MHNYPLLKEIKWRQSEGKGGTWTVSVVHDVHFIVFLGLCTGTIGRGICSTLHGMVKVKVLSARASLGATVY